MQTAIVTPDRLIFPDAVKANKNYRSSLNRFEAWLEAQPGPWFSPDLEAYKGHLAETLAPSSINRHLSAIRTGYRELLKDRDRFYQLVPREAAGSVADQKAWVDELVTRLRLRIEETPAAKEIEKQDTADAEHIRLTQEQAEDLLSQPNPADIMGLRDLAILAVMLCTGIREAEARALDVGDLRQSLGGELALMVRAGKGDKQRLIPYGQLGWVLVIVDTWLEAAEVEAGAVFRAIQRGGHVQRRRPSLRAFQKIIARYPIVIDGQLRRVRCHDLRRTYARRLYQAGVDPVAIQQNLGHGNLKTTLGYIGTLDADRRRPPALYRFDLSKLGEK